MGYVPRTSFLMRMFQHCLSRDLQTLSSGQLYETMYPPQQVALYITSSCCSIADVSSMSTFCWWRGRILFPHQRVIYWSSESDTVGPSISAAYFNTHETVLTTPALPNGEASRSHSNSRKLLINCVRKWLRCLIWRVLIKCRQRDCWTRGDVLHANVGLSVNTMLLGLINWIKKNGLVWRFLSFRPSFTYHRRLNRLSDFQNIWYWNSLLKLSSKH